MDRTTIKNWAKEKIKGHIGELFVTIFVALILTNLTIGGKVAIEGDKININSGINLGFFLYFVEVGLVYYMVNFINDKQHEFKDLFHFINDFVKIFITNLLQNIMIFLWGLLLVIPGIIKFYAYALVPYLLADEKYKDLGYMDILKKSEAMMNGHKWDYFILTLSFIGWHFLALFTLGVLEIWVLPYQRTAATKFLNALKNDFEKSSN